MQSALNKYYLYIQKKYYIVTYINWSVLSFFRIFMLKDSRKINDSILVSNPRSVLLTKLIIGVPIIDDPHDVITGVASRMFFS